MVNQKNQKNIITNIPNDSITFAITDRKLYVIVVTSSIEDNAKLLQQL